jgi:hypothetical protein
METPSAQIAGTYRKMSTNMTFPCVKNRNIAHAKKHHAENTANRRYIGWYTEAGLVTSLNPEPR